MTFVCASCRMHKIMGFAPLEDPCPQCVKVNEVLKDMPPYELTPLPPPKPRPPPTWHPDFIGPVQPPPPRKMRWEAPRIWWPMREERERDDRPYRADNPLYFSYEGRGDPQLGFELFNDRSYSPEYRTQMREQVSIEYDLMPEVDVLYDQYERGRRYVQVTAAMRRTIRMLYRTKNFSQLELATMFNISQPYVSSLLRSKY